ncbi:MAG: hypothetical protein JWP57_4243 [Spirosoma sp.]|nr:hypothetical protein [Spirosoma sp.]
MPAGPDRSAKDGGQPGAGVRVGGQLVAEGGRGPCGQGAAGARQAAVAIGVRCADQAFLGSPGDGGVGVDEPGEGENFGDAGRRVPQVAMMSVEDL